MIVVSACLAGIKCRYDGKAKPNQKIIELVKAGKAILVCPEQLGGLTTPRIAAEIKNNQVITKAGKDVTAEFEKGAQEAFKIAQLANCQKAILKSNSPSCGVGQTYDGSFTGKLIQRDGIFTKLLKQNNIKVLTEEEI